MERVATGRAASGPARVALGAGGPPPRAPFGLAARRALPARSRGSAGGVARAIPGASPAGRSGLLGASLSLSRAASPSRLAPARAGKWFPFGRGSGEGGKRGEDRGAGEGGKRGGPSDEASGASSGSRGGAPGPASSDSSFRDSAASASGSSPSSPSGPSLSGSSSSGPPPPSLSGSSPPFPPPPGSSPAAPRASRGYLDLPPSGLVRFFSALVYIIPYMDSIPLGELFFSLSRNFLFLFSWVGPLPTYYYFHQFAPLFVFFALFLVVVRNRRVHHFVRFHCMQAIILDIGAMLLSVVQGAWPKGRVEPPFYDWFMNFSYLSILVTILYSAGGAALGVYAEVPFISDSAFYQVQFAERM